ncbi:MAG: rhodanese-like domain-containing protein, partial [Desulfurococcaceae archaeon]
KLSKDKIIVLICETGSKSYFLARALREDGFKAYSLKGGVRGYCKLP